MPRGVTLGPRFRDGLGDRVVEVDKATGDTVEVLHLCPELCAFEKAIKDRTDRLSNFRHPRFVPVRGVRTASSPHGRLGVIADHIVGPRLSEVLEASRSQNLTVDTNAVLHLTRELLSAILVLHDSRKVTHGAIAPERLIVTPRGRLVIVDYTLGLALERLQFNRARLWRDFRIVMPPAAGAARFDQRADVVQIGTLALALLLGRPLDTSDYTSRLRLLLEGAGEVTVHGDRKPLSAGLHEWLERALPLEARKPFATAQQANVALEQVLINERRLGVAPAALRGFISRYLSRAGGGETEEREPPTDRGAESTGVVTPAAEPSPSAEDTRGADRRQNASPPPDDARATQVPKVTVPPPADPSRDVPHYSSAVMEAGPEDEGPFAAVPLEIVQEAAPEIVPRIIPERGLTDLGVASGIGSEVTLEVVSGTDTGLTVDVATGVIPETMLEITSETTLEGLAETTPGAVSETALDTVPDSAFEIVAETRPDIAPSVGLETPSGSNPAVALEVYPGIGSKTGHEEAPEVASGDEGDSWAPPAEPVSPPPEAAGVTGFDTDPERILRLEKEFGVEPRINQALATEAANSAALETPTSQVRAVGSPVQKEAASRTALPADLTPEGRVEAGPKHRQPVSEAAPEDVWVIDPSDLTFDPAFLDGLYVAPHADLGPLVPGSREKVHREPAVGDSRPAAERSNAPVRATREAAAIGEPRTPPPAVADAPLEVPPAPVAGEVVEPAVESRVPSAAEVTAKPIAEPVAEVVAPGRLPEVAAESAAPVAAVPGPVEVLPALEANWPFVSEPPAPVAEAVARLVAESAAAPTSGPVEEPVAEAVGRPVAEAVAPPVAAADGAQAVARVAESVAEPVAEAVAPDRPLDVAAERAAPAAAVPEPLEVLPALEASWPFVPESPAPVVEAVAKLAAESAGAPVPGPVATAATEAAAKPVAAAVAALAVEADAESVAGPGVQVVPHEPLDVVAPQSGKERLPTEAPSDALGVPAHTPPAAVPVEEGIQEAVEVFERLLDSLREAPAVSLEAPVTLQETATTAQVAAVGSVPQPASAPVGVTSETAVEAGALAAARRETAVPAPESEVVIPAAHDEKPVPTHVADIPLTSRSATPAFKIEFIETPAPPVGTLGPEPPRSAGDEAAEAPPLQVTRAVIPPPEPVPAPAAPVAIPRRTPAHPTLDIAAAPAGPMVALSGAEAPLLGQAHTAPTGRVLTFEPGPIPGGPAVVTPAGEAPSARTSARVLAFSVGENALRLARAVPRRLIELGRTRIYWKPAAAAAVVLVALGGVRLATAYWFRTPPPTGGLVVETVPDGLDVFVDNTLRGRTPMSLTLPAGDHVLELRGKGLTRTLPVRIAPGIQAEERVSWPLSARTGSLRVESEPTKANVSIDGQPKGVTPLTIQDLPARVHTLVVQGRGGRVERVVTIEPERTTTVKVPVFPGWMKVFAPFDLQIFEGSRLLGTTDVDRIMLRAGRHDIELVNEELGYRVVRQVDVTPGAVTPVSIEQSKGTLQIDAPPGFEVWLDGERVGETPLAPLEVSLGTHEVRFKHPQAGERRQVVVVTQRGPAKVTAEGQ